ncbi:MAG: Succinyl-CoA ligase [ADP-forming] subunit beta [Chlamydiae bacterium]|nr:Succinyl-CoA ligase [ADP-forming] subunit beta [Chlamydiota bacterium]
MYIHEYQAKALLQRYGVPIQPFALATNEDEVNRAIRELDLNEAVLKVQIHAGGRGKAGGVKFAKNPEEIVRYAELLIGLKITNAQTGPAGVVAEKLLISSPVSIAKEFYLAATIDRTRGEPIIIASPEGGMEIEEIAAKSPEKILRIPIGLNGAMRHYQLLRLSKFMGWEGEQGIELMANFARAFIESDCSLLEINPLALTEDGRLMAVDAKCNIDDNALFRQPAIAQWYDPSQLTSSEAKAKEFHLAYVGLDGEIGCMVNGAGLAMATMDIIQHYGGKPANFLDVGGSASLEQVSHGFKLIMGDPGIKSIFVNIFGGIMDCQVLAEGIVHATKEDQVKLPLIVRLEGTNVEKGKEVLQNSGLNIILADSMDDGARKAIEACQF